MPTLSLTIIEILVLMTGAVVLGVTIHFFITSRKNFKTSANPPKQDKALDEWKLKYFNDIEFRDKELIALKEKLTDVEEANQINAIEAEEVKKENKKLLAELQTLRKQAPQGEKPGFVEQLREAKASLAEHNEKINLLLSQIDAVKESEEKQEEILRNNEALAGQIAELKSLLSDREKEVNAIRQKETLTKEVNMMLDSAYSEFNALQHKIQKLETQLNSSKMVNLEFEDLKEAHYKLTRDLEDQKLKYATVSTQNQQLQTELNDAETKLREANFQRQQLQKRVSYLEELNQDLQVVSEANKRLEGQLKRLGELESMLNIVSGERDDLARRHLES